MRAERHFLLVLTACHALLWQTPTSARCLRGAGGQNILRRWTSGTLGTARRQGQVRARAVHAALPYSACGAAIFRASLRSSLTLALTSSTMRGWLPA